MNNILISVIIPVFKVEQFLPQCLDSVMNQTYKNLEIILVDDGSPDRSGTICDDYALKDSRIKVIHKENAGVNEARITGFKESNGEYITFVDSDDYVSPYYVECLYRPIAERDVDISCVQWTYVYEDKQRHDRRNREGFFDKKGIEDILRKDFLFDYKSNTTAFNLGLCCKMIRRKCLIGAMEKARGLWMGEDLISNLYMMHHISSLYVSQDYLYFYTIRQGQSTRNGELKSWENQVDQWHRILEIDKNQYLRSQLPYRILSMMKFYIRNILENPNKTCLSFVENIKNIQNYEIIKTYFCDYKYSSLRLLDKVFVYLIKRKHYRLLYYLSSFSIPFIRKSKELIRKIRNN